MADVADTIPTCPSQMAVLHAAWEAAWAHYETLELAAFARPARGSTENETMKAVAAKATRLHVALLETAVTSNDDQAILLTHIASALDLEPTDDEERWKAISRGIETALAFTLRTARPPPEGANAKVICSGAIESTLTFTGDARLGTEI